MKSRLFPTRLPHLAIALLLVLGAIVLLPWAGGAAPASGGATERISVGVDEQQANGHSSAPALAANGRYVAFVSAAGNLIPSDSNGVDDVFVRDRQKGLTFRSSVATGGGQGNVGSYAPAISADGRYVAFHSFATNFAGDDFNNVPDVFLRDRQSGSTILISRRPGGAPGNDVSYNPAISDDGRYVTFWSYASNLVDGDSNNRADIFRYDRDTNALIRVSVDSNGAQANGDSSHPDISGDGRYIVFESWASNLVSGDGKGYRDVFLRDIATGQTSRLSVPNGGGEAQGDSGEATISDDGQRVAFSSFAANLVGGDSNLYPDIFVRYRDGDTIARVNIPHDGGQSNDWSSAPVISGNGRYVAFRSRATNLVSGDGNGVADIFRRDLQTGTMIRVSLGAAGQQPNAAGEAPTIDRQGRLVAWESPADNLVPGDSNGRRDIFLRDTVPPPPPTPTATPSHTATPTPTPTPTAVPQLAVNFPDGAPGSSFAFVGNHYPPQTSAQTEANGRALGPVPVDPLGRIEFSVCSTAQSEVGLYVIFAASGPARAGRVIRLDPSAPVRPPSGGGPTYCLPPGIALTRHTYLPAFFR